MAESEVSQEFLRDLSVPYDGPKETVLRCLKEFIASHDTLVNEDLDYQLRILNFLHGYKLNSSKKRKRFSGNTTSVTTDETHDSDALAKSFYSQLVLEFLRCKLYRKAYIKFLLHVHDRIIPNLPKPLILTDFLIASFAKGGLISILSLSGLFILIREHHLNFPQFYEHFYLMLTPEVLQAKYRARFFYLADLFMGSTHIPIYTIAAVAKRLSRLSLTAPSDSLPLILTFVMNLIIRHASLEVLIHRSCGSEDIEEDPYIYEEKDMMKCRAMDSSLWELKTLKSHYSGTVTKLAALLDHQLPAIEFDITDHLEYDVAELVTESLSKPFPETTMSKKLWSDLFSSKKPGFSSFWTM